MLGVPPASGPRFTAVDLGRIAECLDQEEAATLAEGGLDSHQLASFSHRPSANMDDSGFFSVQVCVCVCVCVCV